jgi:hypothetical protein
MFAWGRLRVVATESPKIFNTISKEMLKEDSLAISD